MRVDAQRGLVLDQMAVGVPVAVIHLRLRGDGEVVVSGAEELCILHCEVAAVGRRQPEWGYLGCRSYRLVQGYSQLNLC